jgi:hypothetical protein
MFKIFFGHLKMQVSSFEFRHETAQNSINPIRQKKERDYWMQNSSKMIALKAHE